MPIKVGENELITLEEDGTASINRIVEHIGRREAEKTEKLLEHQRDVYHALIRDYGKKFFAEQQSEMLIQHIEENIE